mmetsp:Transcript_29952/g.74976  ORF Transcript_29952/g.74976 Transcript_29952/m.74976 type:complete len:216 (-) Transcript_29952:343-990(-)
MGSRRRQLCLGRRGVERQRRRCRGALVGRDRHRRSLPRRVRLPQTPLPHRRALPPPLPPHAWTTQCPGPTQMQYHVHRRRRGWYVQVTRGRSPPRRRHATRAPSPLHALPPVDAWLGRRYPRPALEAQGARTARRAPCERPARRRSAPPLPSSPPPPRQGEAVRRAAVHPPGCPIPQRARRSATAAVTQPQVPPKMCSRQRCCPRWDVERGRRPL